MLLLFAFFTYLKILQGASIPSSPHGPSSISSTDMSTFILRESAPDDRNHQLRTVYMIVKSCFIIILACVWTSAHPNIKSPRDSGWTCLRRRVIAMLYALLAPEVVLLMALEERSAAKRIAREYNQQFVRSEVGGAKKSLWAKAISWFRPPPKATTWRGDGRPWTIAHGFFVDMGGLILYDGGYPKEILSYERLAKLIKDKAIDAPIVTESELRDRSKGDTASKAIVVLQTSWFVVQCIARGAQHLPLSELEVLTLAFAIMNAAIYAVWWDKPQCVEATIGIPLKREKKEVDSSSTLVPSEESSTLANLPQSDPQHANHLALKLPSNHDEYPDVLGGGQLIWPWRKLSKAPIDADPTFLAACIAGILFGAIHLIAWSSKFPSHRDFVLWRVSAIIVTLEPLLVVLTVVFHEQSMIIGSLYLLLSFVTWFYIPARFALVIIASVGICHPPHSVLLEVPWISYVPHL